MSFRAKVASDQLNRVYNNFDNPTMYGLLLLPVGSVNMVLYYWERRLYERQARA